MLLQASPDPESYSHFYRSFERLHPENLSRIEATAWGRQYLFVVFSYSRFLSEEVLKHPEWMEYAALSSTMHRQLTEDELRHELKAMPGTNPFSAFRRKQLLRILIRDVLEFANLSEVTEEISALAGCILSAAYEEAWKQTAARYGTPKYERGACEFSIIALGKLGGFELNYSSDIDLMFVYSGNGVTDGVQSISNKEFFQKTANLCTALLSTPSLGGTCYRVDLRLRPDGSHGEICLSLEGCRRYYETRARDWELQMLIKARVVAGDLGPGRVLLAFVQPKIYSTTTDFSSVEAVSQTRERIHEKLIQKRGGLDIKLARGGIRDIEFLVQCLQRLHGGREQWLRHGSTLKALARLRDKELLSSAEYSRLTAAYSFLRHLEHRLQFLDDQQTHTLPASSAELHRIARKMPATELGRGPSADKLLHQLNLHLEEVQQTYDRVIHSQQPLYYSGPTPAPEPSTQQDTYGSGTSSNLIRFLDEKAPGLARVLGQKPLQSGLRPFEHFLEKVLNDGARLARLNDDPELASDTLDIFENSPHFGEQLIRHVDLLDELATIRDPVEISYAESIAAVADATELRRFFRREMFGIQARSICDGAEVFYTLGRTSELADATICTAYKFAQEQVNPSRRPSDRMIVIALGRLGMREFDLGSDADLNFVLPDAEAGELPFWTRVAERTIDLLSAYTGEGSLFAVDTRLRPNGRAGNLVQTVSAYVDYLSNSAEAWEGISYMKSRAVAGDSETAMAFLHRLQEVDWQRYGQGGRSRPDLRAMRGRLEREQGATAPLKAGYGGYYDIDFALMYLRLKSAGIFFKVLNTPERIGVLEEMQHLDHTDAAFLRDAASFYRAIDHGLRMYSGHAEGRLPNSQTRLDILSGLVWRWTPEHLHDLPLVEKLSEIQAGTRDYFKRLFG